MVLFDHFFEALWPWDSTIFCNSPSVILEESLATQTILLTLIDKIDTRPLPGRFVTFSVDWKFLIIALMVELSILYVFSYTHFLICESSTIFWCISSPEHTKPTVGRRAVFVRRRDFFFCFVSVFRTVGWSWSSSSFFWPIRHVESASELVGQSRHLIILIGRSAGEPVHKKGAEWTCYLAVGYRALAWCIRATSLDPDAADVSEPRSLLSSPLVCRRRLGVFRSLFFGCTHCDGWLREFGLCCYGFCSFGLWVCIIFLVFVVMVPDLSLSLCSGVSH